MATKIDTINTLQQYFKGVVERADDHAPLVSGLIYKLLGVVIYLKDEDSFIEVRGNDKTGNILWVYINGQRYAFRYEHKDNGSIEIRKNSFKGEVLLRANNETDLKDIFDVFKN